MKNLSDPNTLLSRFEVPIWKQKTLKCLWDLLSKSPSSAFHEEIIIAFHTQTDCAQSRKSVCFLLMSLSVISPCPLPLPVKDTLSAHSPEGTQVLFSISSHPTRDTTPLCPSVFPAVAASETAGNPDRRALCIMTLINLHIKLFTAGGITWCSGRRQKTTGRF